MRRRTSLALLVAVPAFAVDQASKLAAAAIEPANYTHNPAEISAWWDLAVVAVAVAVLLVPFRPLAVAVGLWLGGAAGNVLDAHVWPGGVPDFLRVRWLSGTFNLADVFIALGAAGVGALLLVWVGVSALRKVERETKGPLHFDHSQERELSDRIAVEVAAVEGVEVVTENEAAPR